MKRVLVTGGTRGIGRAIAVLFSEMGYEVAVSFCSSEEEAKKLHEKYGILPFRVDLSDASNASDLALKVLREFGGVDILVNNAGVSSYGLLQDVNDEEYERVFNVNFKSSFFLTKALIPGMIAKKFGRVINISSVWGQTGASCEVLYSASKAAMIGFTKALSKELAPSGITVNCIAPGVVDTDMMASFSEDEKKDICNEIPMERFADAKEIAAFVKMIASEEAGYITGQVIGVNGGMFC